jgi:hypothetical protein
LPDAHCAAAALKVIGLDRVLELGKVLQAVRGKGSRRRVALYLRYFDVPLPPKGRPRVEGVGQRNGVVGSPPGVQVHVLPCVLPANDGRVDLGAVAVLGRADCTRDGEGVLAVSIGICYIRLRLASGEGLKVKSDEANVACNLVDGVRAAARAVISGRKARVADVGAIRGHTAATCRHREEAAGPKSRRAGSQALSSL